MNPGDEPTSVVQLVCDMFGCSVCRMGRGLGRGKGEGGRGEGGKGVGGKGGRGEGGKGEIL